MTEYITPTIFGLSTFGSGMFYAFAASKPTDYFKETRIVYTWMLFIGIFAAFSAVLLYTPQCSITYGKGMTGDTLRRVTILSIIGNAVAALVLLVQKLSGDSGQFEKWWLGSFSVIQFLLFIAGATTFKPISSGGGARPGPRPGALMGERPVARPGALFGEPPVYRPPVPRDI
jgi:hypothetical protein